MKKLALALMLLVSAECHAGLSNCTDMYVGRIWVSNAADGLNAVVFLEQPTDGGGSYWVYFNGWNAEEKRAALALLTGAKLVGHRVNLETTNPDKCGVAAGGTTADSVYLSNSP